MECGSLSAKLFREECSPGIREESRDPPPLCPTATVLFFISHVEGGSHWTVGAQRAQIAEPAPPWGWNPALLGLEALFQLPLITRLLNQPPKVPASCEHHPVHRTFSSPLRSGRQPLTGAALGPAGGAGLVSSVRAQRGAPFF